MATASVGGNLIQFPRSRKRGANMKSGPLAVVTPFPLLTGEALDARLAWAALRGQKWDVDELPTEECIAAYSTAAPLFRIRYRGDEASMRLRLGELESAVTKRKAIKQWLRARGCEARTPDEAVFALFDLLQDPQRA